MVPPEEITKKSKRRDIANYVDTSAINLNKLIDGSSVSRPTAYTGIAIQDLVKRLNGAGLKLTYVFSSSTKIDGRYIKNLLKLRSVTKTSKSMSITKAILLLATSLITMVISELVLNRMTCSHILARAT